MFAALQIAQEPVATEIQVSPQLLNGEEVVKAGDYPTGPLRRDEYGIVSILLKVSNLGRVTHCDITESSGFAELDATTCRLFRRRAKFDPAKSADSSPIAGEFRSSMSWGVGNHMPKTTIDIALQVSKIPANYQSPAKARIIFDASGAAAACEITTSSGSDAADQAACTYIKKYLTVDPPSSKSTNVPATAVRYVTANLSI